MKTNYINLFQRIDGNLAMANSLELSDENPEFNKVKKSTLLKLVEELENSVEEANRDLSYIKATLLVNWGANNKLGRPVLINNSKYPVYQIESVVTYYIELIQKAWELSSNRESENAECKSFEEFKSKYLHGIH